MKVENGKIVEATESELFSLFAEIKRRKKTKNESHYD